MKNFDAELYEVLRILEGVNSAFTTFTSIADVSLADLKDRQTSLTYERDIKRISLQIDTAFWNNATPKERAFAIAHEASHVFLNHEKRRAQLRAENPEAAIEVVDDAMDITVNERLGRNPTFNSRRDVDPDDKFLWADQRFDETELTAKDQTLETLFERLYAKTPPPPPSGSGGSDEEGEPGQKGQQSNGSGGGSGDNEEQGDGDDQDQDNLQDENKDENEDQSDEGDQEDEGKGSRHDHMDPKEGEGEDDKEGKKDKGKGKQKSMMEDSGLEEALKNELSKEELKEFSEMFGSEGGNLNNIIELKTRKTSRKWEELIFDLAREEAKNKETERQATWLREPRNMGSMPKDYIMQGVREEPIPKPDRVKVWFFQDTSGSCMGYQERFFSAAASLPEDKFDLRLFCFDTRVYETTLASGKLYGFGGTSFVCIGQEIMKQEEDPDLIFIITDGWGNAVNRADIQDHSKWHWFLTPYGSEDYITRSGFKQDNIHQLSDYE